MSARNTHSCDNHFGPSQQSRLSTSSGHAQNSGNCMTCQQMKLPSRNAGPSQQIQIPIGNKKGDFQAFEIECFQSEVQSHRGNQKQQDQNLQVNESNFSEEYIPEQTHSRVRTKPRNRKKRTYYSEEKHQQLISLFETYQREKQNKGARDSQRLTHRAIAKILNLGVSTIIHKYRQFSSTGKLEKTYLLKTKHIKRTYEKSQRLREAIRDAMRKQEFRSAKQLSEYLNLNYQHMNLKVNRCIVARQLNTMVANSRFKTLHSEQRKSVEEYKKQIMESENDLHCTEVKKEQQMDDFFEEDSEGQKNNPYIEGPGLERKTEQSTQIRSRVNSKPLQEAEPQTSGKHFQHRKSEINDCLIGFESIFRGMKLNGFQFFYVEVLSFFYAQKSINLIKPNQPQYKRINITVIATEKQISHCTQEVNQRSESVFSTEEETKAELLMEKIDNQVFASIDKLMSEEIGNEAVFFLFNSENEQTTKKIQQNLRDRVKKEIKLSGRNVLTMPPRVIYNFIQQWFYLEVLKKLCDSQFESCFQLQSAISSEMSRKQSLLTKYSEITLGSVSKLKEGLNCKKLKKLF